MCNGKVQFNKSVISTPLNRLKGSARKNTEATTRHSITSTRETQILRFPSFPKETGTTLQ